jgi:hypothetical protein
MYTEITDAHPRIQQPPGLGNVTLKPHQLAMIRAMISLEEDEISLQDHGGYTGKTTVGVLGDGVGMGKSYSVLGLIKQKPCIESRTKLSATSGAYTSFLQVHRHGDQIKHLENVNVVVCPHGAVFDQWVQYIDRAGFQAMVISKQVAVDAFQQGFCLALQATFPDQRRCSCNQCDQQQSQHGVKKRKHTETPCFHTAEGTMRLPDIILVSSTCWNKVIQTLSHKNFSVARVFVDEADSINIPAMAPVNTEMLWAVTGSIHNVAFANGVYLDTRGAIPVRRMTDGIRGTGFVRNVFRSIQANGEFQEFIFLRCQEAFARMSFQIPDYREVTHTCRSPFYVDVLSDICSTEVQAMLDANDVQGAIARIGWNSTGGLPLFDAVEQQINRGLSERRLRLQYLLGLPGQVSTDMTNRVAAVRGRISLLENQLERMRERLSETEQLCPVCYEPAGSTGSPKATVLCCNHVFCMTCLHQSCRITGNKCPMCRTTFTGPECCVVESQQQPPSSSQSAVGSISKVDQVLKIIHDNPDARTLIFSSYDATHETINASLGSGERIPRLCGNSNQMRAILSRFESGERKLLWINSANFGSGINLQCADLIIVFHRMSGDLTHQIIGRAQRCGRTSQLVVHQLTYEGETTRYHLGH